VRNIYFIFLLFIPLTLKAQPDNYARALIDSLCSERYHGRGYVNNGDIKTALFIENEFKNIGLSPINNKYLQKFGFTINSFPGEMFVKLDQKELSPGKDYLIQLYSRSVKGKFKITPINKKDFINDRKMNKLLKRKLTDHFLLVDLSELDNNQKQKLQEELFVYKELAAGLILLNDKKLTWGAGNYFSTLPIVEISKGAWINGTKEIELSIHSELIDNHETYNVIGQVPAEQYSDSFIVFTAHYDHLGRMGKEIIFPGANDNASGTALLLSLAKKYKTKPNIKYNILFIAFAGEEMGLLGSKYFVQNPIIDLKKIKFLINMDLMGTGDEGITVVNSTNNQKRFETLVEINNTKKYLSAIKPRANAPNSDHYPFTQKNVPAVFIYAMGGIQAYHDIYDKPETLPLTKFNEIYSLICDWLDTIK
jgi:hypothetical protein